MPVHHPQKIWEEMPVRLLSRRSRPKQTTTRAFSPCFQRYEISVRNHSPSRNVEIILPIVLVALQFVLQSCAHGSDREGPQTLNGRGTGSATTSDARKGDGPEIRKISRRSNGVENAPDTATGRARRRNARSTRSIEIEEDLSTSELESQARSRELADGEYRWHDYPREVRGNVNCPDVDLVEYKGEILDYDRPLEINPAFKPRLKRFEAIVRDVAVEVYGRPPDRIVNFGGHNCRTVGGRGEKLSEHAFGHAIDVAGFEFDALPVANAARLTHRRAAEAFEVRLEDHWNASLGFARLHREFLRRLTEVLEHGGPFSGMLGPSYPGHDRVFHFDFGPEFFFRL